jgi:hypothetical protein
MSHKFWVALRPTGQPFTVANSPKNDFSSIDLLGEASDLITAHSRMEAQAKMIEAMGLNEETARLIQ